MRRKLSRTHWVAQLLGVPLPKGHTTEQGLILIQVDGLARTQLEEAAAKGQLPFISRSIRRGRFHLSDFYSGIPSTTPAVQGEIFYGIKAAVPAFQFLNRKTGEIFRMFDATASEAIERELASRNPDPLLKGGHSYSNIFLAGAKGSWYCAQDLSPSTIWMKSRPIKWLFLSVVYIIKILRILGLALLELFLAIIDCARGLFERQDLGKELKFVPARVAICIVLREFIRFRVLLDIERGVRIIHANFLGYDEQAHRRGPNSAFAHWTLKGIDRAIRDIHRAALRSDYRDYEIVIYSDHGQEHTVPFETAKGRPLDEAIRDAFSEGVLANYDVWTPGGSKLVGNSLTRWRAGKADPHPPEGHSDNIVITAMGPLGHIYLPTSLEPEARLHYAKALVQKAHIPLVMLRATDGEESTRAFNAQGEWELPRQAAEVLGKDHPFLTQAAKDLFALSQHPNAGDFIISGWSAAKPSITFPLENGSHGGPGSEETRGFILLPDPFPHPPTALPGEPEFVRGKDLHEMAKEFLGGRRTFRRHPKHSRADRTTLRVMTYNIHSCVGVDGKLRPERIARVINQFHPDVIAVQEVDAHRLRSGQHHQAEMIAEHLELHHAFHSMLEEETEKYGIAVFSRHPFELRKSGLLTGADRLRLREARGAIWITFQPPGAEKPVHLINTHFGLSRDERNRQTAEILGPNWLGPVPPDEPIILCGDLNSTRRSVAWRRLSERFDDVQLLIPGRRPQPTFPTMRPLARLDHIFVTPHFKVKEVEVPCSPLATIASDHLPLCVELELEVADD